MDDTIFYTATMAKLCADQGNLLKAAEIYRFLLEREPDRQDFRAALLEIETRLANQRIKDPQALASLFTKWIDLVFRYKKIKILKALENSF
jgi:hypothetical protein